MFNLRSYQTDLISRIAADFSSGVQRVCAVAPCGAGKTVVVGWMAGKTALVNKRVLFLVHRPGTHRPVRPHFYSNEYPARYHFCRCTC